MLAEWECPAISVKTPGGFFKDDEYCWRGTTLVVACASVQWKEIAACLFYGCWLDDALGIGPSAFKVASFLRISGSRLSGGTTLAAICSASCQIDLARSTS